MKITIKVDPDLCIGVASCVAVSPKVFELNAENKAVVLEKESTNPSSYDRTLEVTEEEKENILLAAQSCPTLAISLFDEEGKQFFPEL
ncbi:MAG: ferredoxin [Patescibacteria group bacterium]|jgi:ferredoxin